MLKGHPIRIASKRTGMSPHLIRMWERRYSAISPFRTPNGRRLFTDDDIERLILLRRATLEGEAISQVAKLSNEQLRELIPKAESQSEIRSEHENLDIDQHLNFCIQSIKQFDAGGLETRLLRASIIMDRDTFIEKLLLPLLEQTGEMWSDGRFEIASEHLASAVVRSLLGTMYMSITGRGSDPLLIATTPQGQLHEFGSLISLVTAASIGWRTLYLGPNLPAKDIVRTAEDRMASAVGLSIVYPPDDPDVKNELRKIRHLLDDRISLLVGGRAARSYSDVLAEIGAVRVNGLDELKSELERLKRIANLTNSN